MRHNWQHLSLLLASEAVIAQRVLQGSVQHFQSAQAGPWQPLLTLGFGSEPQDITCIFDSGSSDTIIPLAGSDLCKVKNQQCAAPAPEIRGQFDPKKASDVTEVKGQTFNSSFSGGDQFFGNFIKTTVTVGDKGKVPDAQVALASGGQPAGDFPQFSICGTGPRGNEATETEYDNLPEAMVKTGTIKANVHSAVMNAEPFANGSVFFGGIDRSKFEGELQQVQIDRAQNGKIVDFVVKMTSLRMDMSGGDQGGQLNKTQQRERMRVKRSVRRRTTTRRVGVKANGSYGDSVLKTESVEDESNQSVNVLNKGQSNGKNSGQNKGQNNSENNGKNSGQNNDQGGCTCNNQGNNGNGGNDDENRSGKGDEDNNNGKKNQDSKKGNKNGNKNENGNGNGDNDNNDNGNKKDKGQKNGGNKNDGNKNGGNKNGGNKNGGNSTSGNLIDLGLTEDQAFTLFDTGGVALTLPAGVLKNMAKALDTDFSDEFGDLGPVECGKLNAGNKIVMGFNEDGVQMTLGLDKIRLSEEQTDPELAKAGLCQVGAFAGDPKENLNSMGFVFFTDVYTVFDLDSNSLWFAQAKGDPGAPAGQLEEFPPGA